MAEQDENSDKGIGRLFNRKFLMLAAFVVILTIIFFTTFYEGGISGNVIGYSFDTNNSMNIKTSLIAPDINLNGEYEEITLSIKRGSFIEFDGKKISMDGIDNTLIVKDFKGEIEIDKNKIKRMQGKISGIKINNIPMSSQNGERLSFLLSENANYQLLDIKKDVYIKELSFSTSGTLELGIDSLNLNSEKITLKNYLGGLNIRDEKLFLGGNVESVKIEGPSRKITLSSN